MRALGIHGITAEPLSLACRQLAVSDFDAEKGIKIYNVQTTSLKNVSFGQKSSETSSETTIYTIQTKIKGSFL